MRVRMGGGTISMVTVWYRRASLSLSLFTERRRDEPSGRYLLSNKSAARTRQSVQHYKLVKI